MFRNALLLFALAVALLFGVGCGGMFRGGSASLTASGSTDRLAANLTTRVYTAAYDTSAVDFYLSDLPPEVWSRGGDVSAHAGSIIHIHMFVAPRAGSTPIATSASSATVRWLVLAGGRVGLYGGGGFFTKSGEIGDATLGGRIDHASMRPLRASPGFDDKLGPCWLSASFDAEMNGDEVATMARAFAALAAQSQVLPTP